MGKKRPTKNKKSKHATHRHSKSNPKREQSLSSSSVLTWKLIVVLTAPIALLCAFYLAPRLNLYTQPQYVRVPATIVELKELEASIIDGNTTKIGVLNQMYNFLDTNINNSLSSNANEKKLSKLLFHFLKNASNTAFDFDNYIERRNTMKVLIKCDQLSLIINKNCLIYQSIYGKTVDFIELILESMNSTQLDYCFNNFTSKHGLKLFDIATKSRTQLFAKSLLSSINKNDIKTIDTTLNIMGIDRYNNINHNSMNNENDNDYDYDLSVFEQNLDKYFDSKTIDQVQLKRLAWMVNQRIMEMLIEYGLKFGLNMNDILVDETYNSDEYNQQTILQQWIETESITIVQKVLNKFKLTNLLEISDNLYHFQGFEDIDKYSIKNENNDNKSESKFSNVVYNNDYYDNNIYYNGVLESYNNNYIEKNKDNYNMYHANVIDNWDDFFDFYWKYQIPVIIRLKQEKDGESRLIDKFDISIEQVLKKFGNEKLIMSDIPYANLFGGEIFQGTTQQYFDNLMNGSEWKSNNKKMSNMRPYVFDRDVFKINKKMLKYFENRDYLWNYLKYECGFQTTMQFILGGNNTGSPFHWHTPAFNRLYVGYKQWWIYPPNQSIYTSIHPFTFIFDQKKVKYPVFWFIQKPGDIVFAPNEWSHATININDTLALAGEIAIYAK